MGETLEALRRAHANDPNDALVRYRYLKALVRGGHHEEAQRLLRAQLVCPLAWDELAPTDRPTVRSCDRCERQVHYAESPERLGELGRAGRCVAAPVAVVAAFADATARGANDEGGAANVEQAPPCLVEMPREPFPLEGEHLDANLLMHSGLSLARMRALGVVPLRYDADGGVIIASDARPTEDVCRRLPRALGRQRLRWVYVTPAAIERVIDYMESPPPYEGPIMMGIIAPPALPPFPATPIAIGPAPDGGTSSEPRPAPRRAPAPARASTSKGAIGRLVAWLTGGDR